MKLPLSFTKVTPLSKTFAMVLFVLLPFIGFFFGVKYQQLATDTPQFTPNQTYTPTPNQTNENKWQPFQFALDQVFSNKPIFDQKINDINYYIQDFSINSELPINISIAAYDYKPKASFQSGYEGGTWIRNLDDDVNMLSRLTSGKQIENIYTTISGKGKTIVEAKNINNRKYAVYDTYFRPAGVCSTYYVTFDESASRLVYITIDYPAYIDNRLICAINTTDISQPSSEYPPNIQQYISKLDDILSNLPLPLKSISNPNIGISFSIPGSWKVTNEKSVITLCPPEYSSCFTIQNSKVDYYTFLSNLRSAGIYNHPQLIHFGANNYYAFSFWSEANYQNHGNYFIPNIPNNIVIKFNYNDFRYGAKLFLDSFRLDQDQTSNIINFSDLKINNRVGDMVVTSIQPYSTSTDIDLESNHIISFKGPIEITGQFFQFGQNAMVADRIGVCFRKLDDLSLKIVPMEKEKEPWFCFSNSKLADQEFGTTNSGTATIIIDDYNLVYYPSEVFNTAKLIKVISKY